VTADRSSSYLRVNHRTWMPAYDVHSQHLFMSGSGGGSADSLVKIETPCTNHVSCWGEASMTDGLHGCSETR